MKLPDALKYKNAFEGKEDMVYESLPIRDIVDHIQKTKKTQVKHPCWCQPFLEYRDPLNNNEVWVHNPTQ